MPNLPAATITVKTTLPSGAALYADAGKAYRTKNGGYLLNFSKRHKALRPLAELTIILTARKKRTNAVTHNVQALTESKEWDYVGAGFANDNGSIGVSLSKKDFPELAEVRFYVRPRRQVSEHTDAQAGPVEPSASELAAASVSEASQAWSGVQTF